MQLNKQHMCFKKKRVFGFYDVRLELCTHSEFGVGLLIKVDPGENISCALLYFKDAGTVGGVPQVHFVVHLTGCCALWGKNINTF